VTDRWNGLHQWIIDSTMVNSFKNGLEDMKKTRIWATSRTECPPSLALFVSLAGLKKT